MCFYTSNAKAANLAKRYGIKLDVVEMAKQILEEQKYRINAFTHPACPVVTNPEELEIAHWGLIPPWTRTIADANKIKKICLNARAETMFKLPSFRSPVLSKRCLLPVSGFFEFNHQGNSVIPYYIFIKNEDIFSIGGLYEHWRNPETNETTKTFTVITVPSNDLCSKIHNGGKNPFRMPLIIDRDNENMWLDKSLKSVDIQQFLQPFDTNRMSAYPIAADFLKMKPNDPTIIQEKISVP